MISLRSIPASSARSLFVAVALGLVTPGHVLAQGAENAPVPTAPGSQQQPNQPPPAEQVPPGETPAQEQPAEQAAGEVLTPGPVGLPDQPGFTINPADVVPDADAPVIPLDQMLARAAEQNGNLDVQVLRQRLEQSNINVQRAWAQLLPVVTLAGSYTRNSVAAEVAFPNFAAGFVTDPNTGNLVPADVINVEIQPQNQWAAQLRATVPLLVMPAYFGIANANDAVTLTEQQITFTRNEVFLGISQAYYGAVASKRLIEVAAAQLATAKEQERVAKARFDVGEIPKVGYLRTAVDRARFEQDLRRAQNAYVSNKLALAQLTGFDQPFTVVAPPPVEAPRGNADELLRVALENRKDLAASRTAVDIARRALKAAWWQFAPVVSATGAYNWSNAAGFTGDNETWSVSVNALLTIYDGNRYANVDTARTQLRESELSNQNSIRTVRRDVQQSLLDLESAQANLIKAQEQARLADESAQLVRAQYDAGAATYLDLVDANAASFNARVGEVTEALNVQVASLRLARAIGKFGVAQFP